MDDMDYMDGEATKRFEAPPPALGGTTHAECLTLYRESTEAVLYAKSLQWRTLAYLSAVLGALILIAHGGLTSPTVIPAMIVASFVVSAACIAVLIIYQMWQSTELRKLDFIAIQLSPLFREIRALKSTFEANVHRYLLLTFMVVFILAANGLACVILERLAEN